LPAVLLSSPAYGAQLGERYIDMSATQTSEGSGRSGSAATGQDVTYTVNFELTSDMTNLEGIVVQFCGDSPIVGDASCTAIPGFNTNEGSGLAVANNGLTDHNVSGWTLAGDTDYIILSNATGVDSAPGDIIAFDLGTSAAADGITNPTNIGTFYARITTYSDSAVAAAYTTHATPGAYSDEGGIALSVANHLTVTARVQEVLQFCIGTETGSPGLVDDTDSCAEVSGVDLNLGVVDSSGISTTASNSTAVDNDGLAMVRTNAINGAVVYYKAEQNNSSGKLKISGSACSGVDLDDPCFNSVGTSRDAIAAGVEEFGMALKELTTTYGGATTSLACDAEYEGDATNCTGVVAGDNYAWDDSGNFDTIASSGGPIDDELVRLEFAATASPTTPTGLYTVTANFVATATF